MASGNINLVPLVDILTSIVFFSLLTYQGATMAALTSFDLTLPPVVVNTPEQMVAVMKANVEKFGKIIRAAGIKVE